MLEDNCTKPPYGIIYDTRPAYMGDSRFTSMKDGDEQVNTGAAIPKTNTFSSASPMSQPSIHLSTMSQQKQNSLFETMGPGYPTVIQEASQMVGSLKTVVELNHEFDLEVCQTGQRSKEPRTISMVHSSWGDTSAFQAPGLGSISDIA